MEYKFKAGDKVRHKEGKSGIVIYDEDNDGLVRWKDVAQNRVSHKSALSLNTTIPRWRSK